MTAALPSRGVDLPSYIVRKGDTLYGIARKFGVTVNLLKSINGLRGNLLKPGQRLVLERYKPPEAAQAADDGASPIAGLWSVIENFLDVPYRFGGTGSKGIDCSGFVQKVFQSFSIELPRSAREQFACGTEVATSDLRSGDLLFYRTYAKYPSHVGIYLGDGRMAHASASSRRVVASDIDQPFFRKRFIGARRLAAFAPETVDYSALDIDNAEQAVAPATEPSDAPAPQGAVGVEGR